jgi:hypothetical protein
MIATLAPIGKAEAFKLDCHHCAHTVQFPVVGSHRCPQCGARFEIDWAALHRSTADVPAPVTVGGPR